MLTCVPIALCSWNYRVLGLPAGEGATTINLFSEQGSLSLGGATYEVVKHGPMSGLWTLEGAEQVIAHARKPSALFRAFVVTCGQASLRVQAASPFTRAFEVLDASLEEERDVSRNAERIIGSVRPVHPFTRRGTMECEPAVPQLAQMFIFWLVALSWRRTAKKNS